jgi:hypothetical protein
MSLRGTIALAPRDATFRHEAFFDAGEEEFVAGATAFVRHALAAEEPVLVAVNAPKIALLRESLNGDADEVRFADMSGFGRNPARIIPVWREFVDEYEGRRVSGIGEPIGPDRSPEEMVECQRHESLLNLAFADAAPLRLLCPYDTAGLEPTVIEEARRSHPSWRTAPTTAAARCTGALRTAPLPLTFRSLTPAPAHLSSPFVPR